MFALERFTETIVAAARLKRLAIGRQTLWEYLSAREIGGSPVAESGIFDETLFRGDLDHRPESLDYKKERALKRNARRQQEEDQLRPLWRSRQSDISERQDRAGSWNQDDRYPNPIAPRAYIDFRRMKTQEEILGALSHSRNHLQMRQIVAATVQCRSGKVPMVPSAIDALMDMAQETIGSTRVEDVVGMFLSCARFKIADRGEFLNGLSRLAIDRGFVKDMSIRELATMIHACASLLHLNDKLMRKTPGQRDRNVVEPSTSRAIGFDKKRGVVSSLVDLEELLDVIIEEITLFRSVDDELERRLPSIVKSLTFFGRRDQRLDRLVKRIAASILKADDIRVDRLVLIILSVAECEIIDERLHQRLAIKTTKPETLAAMATTQFVEIVHAFWKLRLEGYQVWSAFFAELAQPARLAEMSRSQMSLAIRILGSVRIRDRDVVEPIVREALSENRMRQMQPIDVVRIAMSLRHLSCQLSIDGSLIVRPINAPGLLSTLKPIELTRLIAGLSALKFSSSIDWTCLTQEVKQFDRLSSMTVSDILTALEALAKIGAIPSVEQSSPISIILSSSNRLDRLNSTQIRILADIL